MRARAREDDAPDAAQEVEEMEVLTQPFHADDHNEEDDLAAPAATTTENAVAPERPLSGAPSLDRAGGEAEEEEEEGEEEDEVRFVYAELNREHPFVAYQYSALSP